MFAHLRIAAALVVALSVPAVRADAQSTTVPAAPSTSAPAPVAVPTQAPENALVTTRVRSEFSAWSRGSIDRKTYTSMASGTYSDALIAQISPLLGLVGTPQTFTYRSASLLLGDLVYRYDVTGTQGAISVLFALDQAGKTDGITFTPLIFRADAQPTPSPSSSPSM